jgi:hypothetical protein
VTSIFREDATALALAEDQTPAKKLANQLMYGIPVAKGGSFYGYAGMGYGGHPEGLNTQIHWNAYTTPVWVVPPSTRRVKVWLVQEEPATGEVLAREEALKTGEANEKLQKENEAVPLPTVASAPHGRLPSVGTDSEAVIWCPATDECWEFHRLTQFVSGPRQGAWKAGNMHYQKGVSSWSGITASGTGGCSASALFIGGGLITLQDLVTVLRGGKVGHALSLFAQVTSNGLVAPARLFNAKANAYPFLEDGITPNPAYVTRGPEKPGEEESKWKEGWADAVPEGTWCRFPPASRPSEYGITNALEAAIYEAIREHGIFVRDSGGNCGIPIADPATLFTPHCDASPNPFHGSASFNGYVNKGTTEAQRAGWIDKTLPTLWEGEIAGVNGILSKQPWRTLELLAPRSS